MWGGVETAQKGKYEVDGICYDDEKMDLLIGEVTRRLKTERHAQKLSVSELCALGNIDSSSLYRLEKGNSHIRLDTFIKCCIALSVPVGDIIPLEEFYKPKTNGERFDKLTRNADPKIIEMFFELLERILATNEKNNLR